MSFWIVGGDLRQVKLAELLLEDGHRCQTYAMEQRPDRGKLTGTDTLKGIEAADCVILPLPMMAEEGILNTKLSDRKVPLQMIFQSLHRGPVSYTHLDVYKRQRLDLKPNPLIQEGDFALLKTHYYGGIRKYQWVSIPLELRGVDGRESRASAAGPALDLAAGAGHGAADADVYTRQASPGAAGWRATGLSTPGRGIPAAGTASRGTWSTRWPRRRRRASPSAWTGRPRGSAGPGASRWRRGTASPAAR